MNSLQAWWRAFERRTGDRRFVLRCLIGIFVLALVLRAILAWFHPMLLPDSFDYLTLAHRIIAGQSYQVTGMYAKRMPGYPVFLAAIGYPDGIDIRAVLMVQALFGALVSVVVFALARPWGAATGLLAALLVACDPLCIGFSAAVLTEIPFMLVFIISLLLLAQLVERSGSLWRWVLFAVSFAIGVYVRAEVSLCLFPLLIWVVYRNRNGQALWHAIGGSLLAMGLVMLILLPWWLRNNRLFHQDFFRFTTLQGISLYESVYKGATGGPRQSDIVRPPAIQKLNESQRDLAWTHRAVLDMYHHPFRMLRLAFLKVGRTWSPWLHARGYARPWINISFCFWYVPLFFLALAGLPMARKRVGLTGVMLIPILYFTIMHAVFLGSVRYRVPVMPLVCIFAAAAPAYWIEKIGCKGKPA